MEKVSSKDSMIRKEILLISFFESHNLGDKAIANSFPNWCEDEVKVYKLHFGKKPSVENHPVKKNTLYKIKLFIKKLFETLLPINVKYFILFRRNKRYYSGVLKNILKEIDIAVFWGGNQIFDIVRTPYSLARFDALASVLGEKKLVASSIGVGPILTKFSRNKIKEVVKRFNYFSVRDNSSYNIVESDEATSIYESVDHILGGYNISQKPVGNNGIISVNLLNYNLIDVDKVKCNDYYIKILRTVEKYFKEVHLLSSDSKDYEIYEELIKQVEHKSKFSILSVENYIDLEEKLANTSSLIGMRMHTLILGYKLGIPITPIIWQEKVDSFLGQIEYIGKKHFLHKTTTFNINSVVEYSIMEQSKITIRYQNELKNIERVLFDE